MRFLVFLVFFINFSFAENVLTGIIKPIYEAKISVSTDGIVSNIYFQEGQKVKKGDVILKLDDKLQDLETRRRKVVLDDKTQVDALEKNVKILEEILRAKEELYEKTKSISLNEINSLRMQFISANAEYQAQVTNKVKEDLEYNIALKLLDYYKIKSPVNGEIIKITPKIGEWVQTGNEIVHIVDTDICYVEIDLDTKSLQELKLNSKVSVEVEIDGKIIKKDGKVTFISAIADSSSTLIRAKINFDNKTNKVTPGLHAKIIY